MNVLLAAVSGASNISGIQRHAFNVARCLMLQPQISTVHLVIAPWQEQMIDLVGLAHNRRLRIHVADMGAGSITRNAWYWYGLPKLAALLQPDVIHLSYPVPVKYGLCWPTVVSLHDLYPYEVPGNFRFPHVWFNQLVLQQCLRTVDAIACVSDTTLHRLKQHTRSSIWQKALRIYNCVEPGHSGSRNTPIPDLQDKPFLLCVAQHRHNKNIPLLIRVFQRLLRSGDIHAATRLVVVGIPGPETPIIRALIDRGQLAGKVHLLSGLTEPELYWCYRYCDALIVPSMTEGFGLPVAEGLLAGCRIVCSDIPALREVGRHHCTYFDLEYNQEESLAAAILNSVRRQQQEPIPLRHLSAKVLGSEYVALYRHLLSLAMERIDALYAPVRTSETLEPSTEGDRGGL
jgi:glycosyltransferase involved in cell wall biosynthesis